MKILGVFCSICPFLIDSFLISLFGVLGYQTGRIYQYKRVDYEIITQ